MVADGWRPQVGFDVESLRDPEGNFIEPDGIKPASVLDVLLVRTSEGVECRDVQTDDRYGKGVPRRCTHGTQEGVLPDACRDGRVNHCGHCVLRVHVAVSLGGRFVSGCWWGRSCERKYFNQRSEGRHGKKLVRHSHLRGIWGAS